MDTFGSTVDLPCIFQDDCTVHEPTQFGAEAVLAIESTQALPIDLNCKLPDLSFDIERSTTYNKDKDESTVGAEWTLMGTLVLDGGTYALSDDHVGGTYITTERVYVPDLPEAIRTVKLQAEVDNVTLKISTSPKGTTLLDR